MTLALDISVLSTGVAKIKYRARTPEGVYGALAGSYQWRVVDGRGEVRVSVAGVVAEEELFGDTSDVITATIVADDNADLIEDQGVAAAYRHQLVEITDDGEVLILGGRYLVSLISGAYEGDANETDGPARVFTSVTSGPLVFEGLLAEGGAALAEVREELNDLAEELGLATASSPPETRNPVMGAVTDTQIGVGANLTKAGNLGWIISEDADFETIEATLAEQAVTGLSAYSTTRFPQVRYFTGLDPATLYYIDATVGGVRQNLGLSMRTFPAQAAPTAGNPHVLCYALISCTDSYSFRPPIVYNAIAADEDVEGVIHLGDMLYPDRVTDDVRIARLQTIEGWLSLEGVSDMLATRWLVYGPHDHDGAGPGDPDINTAWSNGSTTAGICGALRQWYHERLPHYDWTVACTEDPAQPNLCAMTFDYGRLRLILPDTIAERDGSSETLLGATQKAWFLDLIENADPEDYIGQVFLNTSSWQVNNFGSFGEVARAEAVEIAEAWRASEVPLIMDSGDCHELFIDDGTWTDMSVNGNAKIVQRCSSGADVYGLFDQGGDGSAWFGEVKRYLDKNGGWAKITHVDSVEDGVYWTCAFYQGETLLEAFDSRDADDEVTVGFASQDAIAYVGVVDGQVPLHKTGPGPWGVRPAIDYVTDANGSGTALGLPNSNSVLMTLTGVVEGDTIPGVTISNPVGWTIAGITEQDMIPLVDKVQKTVAIANYLRVADDQTLTRLDAINDFLVAGGTHGWLSRTVAFHSWRASSAAAALVNWIDPDSYLASVVGSVTWVEDSYVQPAGSVSGYIDTGFVPGLEGGQSRINCGFGAYFTENVDSGTVAPVGNGYFYIVPRTGSNLRARCFDLNSSNTIPNLSSDGSGWFHCNRASEAEFSVWRNGVLQGYIEAEASTSQTVERPMLVGGNNGGTPTYQNRKQEFLGGFLSMTQTQIEDFYDDLATLRAAIT